MEEGGMATSFFEVGAFSIKVHLEGIVNNFKFSLTGLYGPCRWQMVLDVKQPARYYLTFSANSR